MVIGIGTDITKKSDVFDGYIDFGDAFVRSIFTAREMEEAGCANDRKSYLVSRFSGKEAVYKSLGTHPDGFRAADIEILNNGRGLPCVVLHGEAKNRAESAGIKRVLLSLSDTDGFVVAQAIATGEMRIGRSASVGRSLGKEGI